MNADQENLTAHDFKAAQRALLVENIAKEILKELGKQVEEGEDIARKKIGKVLEAHLSELAIFNQAQTPRGVEASSPASARSQVINLQLFETLIEKAAYGVLVTGIDGVVQYANPAALRLHGLTEPAEILGKQTPGMAQEEMLTIGQDLLPALAKQGQWNGRIWYQRADGQRWLGQHSCFLIRGREGEAEAIAAFSQDITGEHQVQQEFVQLNVQLHAQAEALQESQKMLSIILDNTPGILLFAKNMQGQIILCNQGFETFLQQSRESLYGKTVYDILPKEAADFIAANEREMLEQGKPLEVEEEVRKEDGTFTYVSRKFPLYDKEGVMHGLFSLSTDITERKRVEEERAVFQNQVIAMQREAMLLISTPLIPLADGVVVMPLIGSIDNLRVQQVMETLLEGIVTHQAEVAILDITGVPTIDNLVANALMQTAQAVNLLGAEVVLTGIQPKLAQTLVALGADLRSLVTRSSLQSGIAYALERKSRR